MSYLRLLAPYVLDSSESVNETGDKDKQILEDKLNTRNHAGKLTLRVHVVAEKYDKRSHQRSET